MLAGLAEKTIVVTGAAAGLGRSVTERLLSEGAAVVAVDRDDGGLQGMASDLANPQLLGVCADVSTAEGTEHYFSAALERFGRIDGLHANAGIFTAPIERFGYAGGPAAPAGTRAPGTLLVDTEPDDFDRVIATNLRGVFLGVRRMLQIFRDQGTPGSIVTTASVAGIRALWGGGAYCASKAGVIAITRTAAIEGGPDGHRVNAVLPGSMETSLADRIVAYLPPEARGDFQVGLAASAPMGRVARVTEVAALAVWLLSEESTFVNGGTFTVDGGMMAG